MRMTKEQLLDAARRAAKYLPAASAELMNELANRLDVTSVALSESLEQRSILATENAGLKSALTAMLQPGEAIISREHRQASMNALKNPATDAVIVSLRQEGAFFVANRMLAAWDSGFIEDTAKNVSDIARMILTSTEFMAAAPEGDFNRSFADSVLKEIAAKFRERKGAIS